MRPILLTGAAGFVGHYMIPRLRKAFPDRSLVTVVRDPPALPGGHAVDLTDRERTDHLIGTVKPQIVVHLAAYSSVAKAREKPNAVWRDNRDGTYCVARAINDHVPDATVLFASTGDVYGKNFNAGPASEETMAAPNGPYANSKRASEVVLRQFLPDTARLIVARPFNHTGPGQAETFVVASFANQLVRIKAGLQPPKVTVGNLAAERDFLDVRDVADCYVRLLLAAEALPHRMVVNVARGTTISIAEILERLRRIVDVDVEIEVDQKRLRPNEIPVATASTQKLAQFMDWPPNRDFDETLRDIVADKTEALQQTSNADAAETGALASGGRP